MHLRNMWAVDGLYYLGIEELCGTKAATEIDRKVWDVMGKIEARRIKKLFGITETDIPSMIKALSYSGWALDLEDKEILVENNKAIVRNTKCRVQNTRIEKLPIITILLPLPVFSSKLTISDELNQIVFQLYKSILIFNIYAI